MTARSAGGRCGKKKGIVSAVKGEKERRARIPDKFEARTELLEVFNKYISSLGYSRQAFPFSPGGKIATSDAAKYA